MAHLFKNLFTEMPFRAWRASLHLVTIHISYRLNTFRLTSDQTVRPVCFASGKGLTDSMCEFQQCRGVEMHERHERGLA